MKVKFEFSSGIKKLLSEEKIDPKKIKDLIRENYLAEDLESLDKKGIKFKEILIKINGIKMYNSKSVYINLTYNCFYFLMLFFALYHFTIIFKRVFLN